MTSASGPARIRVVTAAVLFAVFIAGLATGAATVYLTRERHFPHQPPGTPSLRGITLSDAQRAHIDEIRARYRPQLDAILHESFPRVRAIEDKMDTEIRAQLTPEQQRQFDDNEKHRPPFPGPPPGGGPPPGPPPF